MGDKTHPKTNMNMKIVFAIALVFIAAVACAHDAEFSETTTPENEQLDSVAVTESSGDNAQAGWGRRRRRRWRHVAERKLKHSAALLRKHISERKGKERKKKERASKEKQAKIKEKHAKHVAERKGKERKAKELGHKKYMELKSKHNKNKKVRVCWIHTYYKHAKCTAHPLSWYTNCPKGRRAGWKRCGFLKLGGQFRCRHRHLRCKMTANKNRKGFKKFKRTAYKGKKKHTHGKKRRL